MSNQTARFEYEEREITVEYYIEDNRIYIEGIMSNGQDVTDELDHDKVYREMPEAIYQSSIYDDEANLDL